MTTDSTKDDHLGTRANRSIFHVPQNTPAGPGIAAAQPSEPTRPPSGGLYTSQRLDAAAVHGVNDGGTILGEILSTLVFCCCP